MDHLKGKAVVITGASRGIGEAAARLFAQAGAKVVLAARSVAACQAITDEIAEAGGEARAVACDVADPQSVADAIAACENLHIRTPGQLTHNARVLFGQRQRHISCDRRDPQNLDLIGRAKRQQNGNRVVLSGVGVDDDFARAHGSSVQVVTVASQAGLVQRINARHCARHGETRFHSRRGAPDGDKFVPEVSVAEPGGSGGRRV